LKQALLRKGIGHGKRKKLTERKRGAVAVRKHREKKNIIGRKQTSVSAV